MAFVANADLSFRFAIRSASSRFAASHAGAIAIAFAVRSCMRGCSRSFSRRSLWTRIYFARTLRSIRGNQSAHAIGSFLFFSAQFSLLLLISRRIRVHFICDLVSVSLWEGL